MIKAYPINRGAGSRSKPLSISGLTADNLRSTITAIATHYGSCYVDIRSWEDNRAICDMFEEGLVIPVPRTAGQPKWIGHYQVTGRARELYGTGS